MAQKNTLYRNREWLEGKYVYEGWSLRAISRHCGVCHTTVSRWVRKFKLKKHYNDREKLRKAYLEKELSCREIAAQWGCGKTTVQRRLKEFNIERPKSCPIWHSVSYLEYAYLEKGQTSYEIASALRCSQSTIFYALQDAEIETRPPVTELRGPVHPSWRGGSDLNKRVRDLEAYKTLRKDCFERDNYTCVTCGHRGGDLHADHVRPLALLLDENEVDTLNEALDTEELDTEELWDLANLRTLCIPCHKRTPTYSAHLSKQREL